MLSGRGRAPRYSPPEVRPVLAADVDFVLFGYALAAHFVALLQVGPMFGVEEGLISLLPYHLLPAVACELGNVVVGV